MLKDIVAIKPLEGYQLLLRFEDRIESVVDISQLIQFSGIFAPCKIGRILPLLRFIQNWARSFRKMALTLIQTCCMLWSLEDPSQIIPALPNPKFELSERHCS